MEEMRRKEEFEEQCRKEEIQLEEQRRKEEME